MASTKNEITQLSNKTDKLAVELKHEKDQRRHHLDFVPKRQTRTRNAPFFKPSTTSRYKQSYSQNYRFPRDHIKTRFPDPQTGFCFYHSKFGKRANKCSNPCTFQKNQTKSINRIDPFESSIPLSEATSLPKIRDKISGMLFLLDTGACFNFLPLRDSDTNKEETNFQFLTANGTSIKCFGKTDLEIDVGFGKMKATFHICAIEQPILGFHFMHQNWLTLDAQLNCLRCPDTEMKVNTIPMPVKDCEALPVHECKYLDILDLYPNLTVAPNYRKPVKLDIVHHLPTKGQPPNIKTCRVSPEKYIKMKQQIEEMIKSCLLIPSNLEFGSPLHLVSKANTTELRLVGDYKVLNKMLTSGSYPLPHLRTAYELLHGSNIFSTVDLKSAFHHVPIALEDVHKTTIRTLVGAYAFTITPFGLSTSVQVFQRLIDTVICGLPFVYAYVDDILIFSKDEKEHLEHHSILFQRLNNFGLAINLKKCRFGSNENRFLGHVITPQGISPATDRIEAVCNFIVPLFHTCPTNWHHCMT